jgi:hypothetical protein
MGIRSLPSLWMAGFAACAVCGVGPAEGAALELRRVTLSLPGPVSNVIAADVDGDGRRDIAVVTAFTRWEQESVSELVAMDQFEGLVESLTIVPILFDQRELHVLLADPAAEEGYRKLPVVALGPEILGLEAGPPGLPLVALTDAGLSVVRLDGGATLRFEPYLADPPILAGTGTFVPRLDIVHDLDADGRADLLWPSRDGAAVYLNPESGLAREAAARLELPTDDRRTRDGFVRRYPLPRVQDVDGDRLPDLLFPGHAVRWKAFFVLRNLGGGRFGPALGPFKKDPPCKPGSEGCTAAGEEVVHFGDLDGDGRAEYITTEEIADPDAGMREELRQAKEPRQIYRLYRSEPDLRPAATPYRTFEAVGYTFESGDPENENGIRIPGGLQDLNGDGRLDLISVRLDFSLMQALRVLTVQSISLGLDFGIYCQTAAGGFEPVSGLDLGGKLTFDLNNLKLGRLAFFGGDFDGDGKADFVRAGRGRQLTVHRGKDGCSYPSAPDLTLQLREEPRDVALLRIAELDGDGKSDLWLVQPNVSKEAGVSPTVDLELYLSGGHP